MRKFMISAAAVLLAATLSGFANQISTEEAAVREAVNHYLLGHATGDGAHFKVLFHPESKLFFIRDGQFTQLTSADYIARAAGKPAADEAQRNRWISSVDITGTAAVARIVLDYPSATLTDYLSLLKINGEWKVVNKIFHSEPRAQAAR